MALLLYNIVMSVKYLLLLIVFLFNTVATAIAESSHIEIETHSSSIAHDENHHDHSDATTESSDEHCPDHDECHDGHFHHYLIFPPSNFSVTPSSIFFEFAEIHDSYISNFPEIIKPPLLIS